MGQARTALGVQLLTWRLPSAALATVFSAMSSTSKTIPNLRGGEEKREQ